MTKKTFKDSAAIQFISDADKKDKTEEQLEISELHENIPEGYKINPKYVEKKTKRLNLLVKPSLYDSFKQKSDKSNISFNELVGIAMEKFMESWKDA